MAVNLQNLRGRSLLFRCLAIGGATTALTQIPPPEGDEA